MQSEIISEETRIEEKSARRKDNVCAICMGHFKKSRSTKCDHDFCTACLHGYFTKSAVRWRVQCPICKTPCLFWDLFPNNCSTCHNRFSKISTPITFQCGCGIHKNCKKCWREFFKNRWTIRCAMGCGQKIQWNDVFKEPHPDDQQIKKRKMIAKYKLFEKGLMQIAMLAYLVNAYLYFAKEVIILAAIFYFVANILFAFTPPRFVQPAFLTLAVGNRIIYAIYLVEFAFFSLFLMFGNLSTFAMFYVISCVIFIAAILIWDLNEYNYIHLTSFTFSPGTLRFSALWN